MRKLLLTTLFGFAVGIIPVHAEVVVKIRPPVSIREHRTARPSREHVWVRGYHHWDGNAYHWRAGHWEKPPRPRAVWVAPRYTRRHDGYVYTEGHWR